MGFEGWQLGLIDEAGYNGISDEHIDRVAGEIREMGVTCVDNEVFYQACRNCCIDPDNFTQEDVYRLERKLNG